MSRWVHPGLSPHLEDEDWDDSVPVLSEGSIDSNEIELPLSANEMEREKRLRREALKRKRPPGFAAWPS